MGIQLTAPPKHPQCKETTTSQTMKTFISSLALLDIPNHIHILLILIQVFTRDGQQMEKQSKVDTGRSYYLQLLFKYMEVTHPREECPRLIAALHRVLQTVKESAEKIRAFEIVSVKM